jgi:serine/threonine-protein kinase
MASYPPHDLLQLPVQPGEVLAGKYRVERVLGRGGMGVVVAAHHLVLEEKVAIKLLLPEAMGNAEAVGRFVREAKAAVRIRNEHVARVSDVGYLESGAPYIVMELLEGVDLGAWLKRSGPLAVDQAVWFVLQACEAIAEAHAVGIVHRDLKPANLFWTQRADGQPCIKVLDFGISKMLSGTSPGDMTRTNAIIGSPYYMSPEQMHASRNVDARTDVWSMGVILFELLSLKPPFLGESMSELAINVATSPPLALRSLRPEVPAGLEQAIARALEKARDKRWQSIADFAVAIGEFAPPVARTSIDRVVGTLQRAGVTTHPPPALSAPTLVQSSVTATASSWGQTGRTSSRRATIAGIAALGFVVLLVGAVAMFRLGESRGTGAAAAGGTSSVAPPPPASSVAAVPPSPSVAPPEPSASVAAASSAAPPARPVAPGPAPVGPGHHVPSPAPSAGPAPTAAPNAACTPPYYFDAQGHKQYKPECM